MPGLAAPGGAAELWAACSALTVAALPHHAPAMAVERLGNGRRHAPFARPATGGARVGGRDGPLAHGDMDMECGGAGKWQNTSLGRSHWARTRAPSSRSFHPHSGDPLDRAAAAQDRFCHTPSVRRWPGASPQRGVDWSHDRPSQRGATVTWPSGAAAPPGSSAGTALPLGADPNYNPPVGGGRPCCQALLEAIMQAGASSQGAFDTSMLSDITALDILRLQAMNSPPRGLVLVIGSLGVLIGLADELPDWAGCQKVLHAQPAKPIARWRGGSGSLWQCLRSFEPANVTPAQRQCVLAAQQADIGGLMTPRHLEGVSGGAAALALWLHTAMQLVDSGPAAAPPQEVSLLEAAADRRESLFDAPAAEQCKACGKRMPIELMAAHVPACRSREEGRESAR